MSTYITRLDATGAGPRLAVKDLVDVAGIPTTAGCRAVERTASPAARDAACLAGARAAGARIVGKANLHELAMLPMGVNPWFGTPMNPLDPAVIPGGSSSGSAVAVAEGSADVALGSDTGGSVRIPSACCGTVGLKTTHGRVPLEGVWPLAPSLDTVGPMATTVAGLELGMQLLEPRFAAASAPARTVGRLRTDGLGEIEAAVDDALRRTEFEVVELDWDGLARGAEVWSGIYFAEIWQTDGALVRSNPENVGEDIATMIGLAELLREQEAQARSALAEWREELLALFDRVEVLALPTLPIVPPRIEEVTPATMAGLAIDLTRFATPFNVAGLPCTAQPVPASGSRIPPSLQLVGRPGGEELLLTTAAHVEAALG